MSPLYLIGEGSGRNVPAEYLHDLCLPVLLPLRPNPPLVQRPDTSPKGKCGKARRKKQEPPGYDD